MCLVWCPDSKVHPGFKLLLLLFLYMNLVNVVTLYLCLYIYIYIQTRPCIVFQMDFNPINAASLFSLVP